MCNNNDNGNNCENCIGDILKVILILQQKACQNDSCIDSCDRAFLGPNGATFLNTRPFELYMCGSNGVPLAMPISRDPAVTETSTVFRIEKMDECCATCRVLVPNTDPTSTATYEATNSLFTINLNCVCIIRCLPDTFVEAV